MANLNYPFSLMMRFLLFSSLLFILVSCFVKRSNALESRKETAIESHYHTVEISSLLPASVCNPSTTKGSNQRQSTLQVFHRHGPCSHQPKNTTTTTPPPPLTQLLSDDQSRVKSIQARVNLNKIKYTNSNSNNLNDKKPNLPLQSGRSLGSGNYVVSIGLGTPTKTVILVFDTGSDLTWTQCEPCIRSCYQQQDPIFNPSTSTSYSNASCDSPQCLELTAATRRRPRCAADACVYEMHYGDQSFSVGLLSKDKLTLTETDVFPSFYFGCGQNNQGLFGQTDGLLGLGRNPLSILSQTAPKYGKYFSYCLPSISSSTGHLTLGKIGFPRNMKFTPFSTSKQGTSFYFIDIVSIIVGGRQLPISQSVFNTAGGIIDSGTVITRLPPAAYGAMSSAFRRAMARYPSAPAYSILDTCYDLSGYTRITIPIISFIFNGNVKIDLDSSGVLIVISRSRVCFAFVGNDDEEDVAIFGNTQQKTFEVVYDVGGGNLGFAAGGC